ncbi:hypothetical protein ACN47E_006571 [Coniothyrium glycines]
MEPPVSPSKLVMSPGMASWGNSPSRAAGTASLYSEPPVMSPSAPNLRASSPLRSPVRIAQHRRTDSDVSVQGLATMFENLEVKDPREASKRFKEALERERLKHAEKLSKLEKEYARKEEEHHRALDRRDVRIDELKSKVEEAEGSLETGVTRAQYEKERKAHKANVANWEKVFQQNEEKWKGTQAKLQQSEYEKTAFEQKYKDYKRKFIELQKDNLRTSGMIPTLQTKIQGLQRNVQRAESDVRFKSEEAAKYQNQVYSLQIELEGVSARLSEEVQTLKDRLRLTEGERDALKTNLKEEEIMRIAAEGQLALPTADANESDEFGSPMRSPRKPRMFPREDDDKENVSPKKGAVELRFIQQELATERRLREKAEEQIEFMKMECQFQCCSCRIAENQGKQYIHDDTYSEEMQHIKMAVPMLTPPSSHHEDDLMDGVIVEEEVIEVKRPFTPLSDMATIPQQAAEEKKTDGQSVQQAIPDDMVVAFSPSTGTFRSVPSPVKADRSISVTSVGVSTSPILTEVVGIQTAVVHQTASLAEDVTPQTVQTDLRPLEVEPQTESNRTERKIHKLADISIHEDAIEDSGDEDDEAQSPTVEPSGPATPYFTRTITTTTTIPLHFSPATPAFKPGRGPMTPSTVAHAAADARTPVLGELSLNKLPFDREAALEAIRQRRGRARSMAAGHGTPMKQMVQGVKDRRDISAPVSRVRQ